LRPRIVDRSPVHILVPEVDLDLCTRCGRCAELCEFSAIAVIRDAVLTFPELCAGCGVCSFGCPVGAIAEVERHVGVVTTGITEDGVDFHQGCVDVGEQRSGPVTKAVKLQSHPDMITVIDAPPGTACPMQETVEGSDYCILVTEPTPFGLSDLKAAVDTCQTLRVPCGVIINRDGIGDAGVSTYCDSSRIPVLLRIPHERRIAEAYSRGETLSHALPEWRDRLCAVYDQIAGELAERGKEMNAHAQG
jgi:MinD superfamily P-loop ATPase